MSQEPNPYSPIDCEFHDRLEAAATLRRIAELQFRDEHGRPRTVHARIRNVFARAGAEYLELDTGECIRLDRLLAIDGSRLA